MSRTVGNHSFLKPFTFTNGATVRNRIVMAPMTTMSSFFDGSVSGDEIEYYRHRSGPGMVITAVANVDEGGKGFEGEMSVADDRFIPGLSQIAAAIRTKGSKAILQIFSAGRKTDSKILRGRQPYSASAVPARRGNGEIPHALTEPEIKQLIDDFGHATRRAIEAGFDGVEIHGANTYLIQQFFSPHSNRRDDQWGGTREKRMRFPLAVIKACREAIDRYARPDFILGYRLSPEELEEPGIRIEDTLALVDVLAQEPIDYLHISMGDRKRTSLNDPSDTEPTNSKIVRVLAGRKPLIEVGSIETPADADEALADGADFAAIGRELIREPLWLDKVIAGDEAGIRYSLDPAEMDELRIPRGLQRNLVTGFSEAMRFTGGKVNSYRTTLGPMEGGSSN